MNAKQEYITCDEYSINSYTKDGYEVVDIFYIDNVQNQYVQDEVPSFQISYSGDSGNAYNNSSNRSVSKQVPVVLRTPRFLLRLNKTAKILYGEKGNAEPQSQTGS